MCGQKRVECGEERADLHVRMEERREGERRASGSERVSTERVSRKR